MEELDLSPSKDVYKAVKSDVTPISAIKELIDNALDNWERLSGKTEPAKIEITYDDEGDELVIRDNTGGVEETNIQILFALGESKKEAIDGSIGAYGIGAKKAIVNLGNEAVIKSRHRNADDGGYGFRVDQEWLKDEQDWTVDKQEFELERGVTEIRIQDLNVPSWDSIRSDLIAELQQTYQKFLQPNTETGELTIILDGEAIASPEPINWSFTPFDGLYPRRYENIEISDDVSQDYDEPVFLHITVGLLQKGSEKDAGTDVYCQNRQVLRAVTDERGGYGELGNFGAQHRNLKIILEFETDGDADLLPWDTQKNDINPFNPLSQIAFDWVRRAAKPYYKADFTSVPRTFLQPYGADAEFAANYGEVEAYDYHGRQRVTQKPDEEYSQVKEVQRLAKTHAFLRIYYTSTLKKWQIPGYELELRRQFQQWFDISSRNDIQLAATPEQVLESFGNDDGPTDFSQAADYFTVENDIYPIDGPAPDLEDYSIDEESADEITYIIEQQADAGQLCENLKEWQIPSYVYHYSKHLSDGQEPRFSTSARNPFTSRVEDENTEEVIQPDSLKIESDDSDTASGSTTQIDLTDSEVTDSTTGRQDGTDTDRSRSTGQGSTTTSVSQSRAASGSSTQRSQSSSDRSGDTATPSESIKQIVIKIPDEQWDQLCDSLGLPSDASEERVGQKLLEERLE